METIKNYLDNMFAGLPKTSRVLELKNNILSNMEDKYNELKSQGKSENEAIGIVISEFGNIDELVSELGIRKDDQAKTQPLVTKEEVESYLFAKKRTGFLVGIGVFLCILGAAMLILLSTLIEDGIILSSLPTDASDFVGIIVLLVMVTIAVGIFIYSGMCFERYAFMEQGVQLPGNLEAELRQRLENMRLTFNLKIIIGVCMIVLSPIALFVGSMISDSGSTYGLVILLLIVACSVFLFIAGGAEKEGFERLLKVGDYTEKKMSKKEDKVIGAVASIVWPLAVIIFLFCGFVYELWYIAWIVFPIVGLLFGMFCAAYSIITDKN